MDPYRDVVERLQDGDRGAFDELMGGFWVPILGYFRRRLPRVAAEEATQTVFVKVYRTLRSGGGGGLTDRESWSKYLFAAARNVYRDHRDVDVRLEDLYPEEASAAESVEDPHPVIDPLESAEARAALEACLDELDAIGRRLAWSHFVDGRSKRELARVAGRPESSIRVEMVRVLARLRACVEGKGVTP